MRTQRPDVEKALCSVRKMNLGGDAVALAGGRSYTQRKENGQRTRVSYEEGQRVTYLRLPAKEEEGQEETEKVFKCNRLASSAAESGQALSRRV